MFQAKVVEEFKTHLMFRKLFPKMALLLRYCGKMCTAGQATDDNIIGRMRAAYWISETHTHSDYIILIAWLV
jgi:hypothetical protein